MKTTIIKYIAYNEQGEYSQELEMEVPAINVMCDKCEGEGKVDHPAFSNGITQSERREMGEEDFRSYMDGDYDVTCDCCKGQKVIRQPNISMMSMLEKRFAVKVRQYDREQADFERESAAEQRAEMNFGRGYFA